MPTLHGVAITCQLEKNILSTEKRPLLLSITKENMNMHESYLDRTKY